MTRTYMPMLLWGSWGVFGDEPSLEILGDINKELAPHMVCIDFINEFWGATAKDLRIDPASRVSPYIVPLMRFTEVCQALVKRFGLTSGGNDPK